jgi:pimeloyl-ACP methyl ester carboxylesterase
MSQYADWLFEALTALGIARCQIVGHHTGACIGVEMVGRQPQIAKSLAMVGPVPLTAEERLEFSKHFGIPFTPTVSGGYLLDNWQYLRDLGAAKDVMLFHREMADQLRAWDGRVKSYAAVWGQDFVTPFKAAKCPLWIGAAPDDVLFPYFERAKGMRPDAEAHVLEGANFEPDLGTDVFVAALTPFLAKNA